eukprot:1007076-Prorocentrum_minimum.AAC.1
MSHSRDPRRERCDDNVTERYIVSDDYVTKRFGLKWPKMVRKGSACANGQIAGQKRGDTGYDGEGNCYYKFRFLPNSGYVLVQGGALHPLRMLLHPLRMP